MQAGSDQKAAVLLETATTYLNIFSTLDPDVIVPIQSENYVQDFAPASLNVTSSLNRDAFASHIQNLSKVMKSFPVYAKQIWPNPSLNQVTIWADSETEFHDHVKDTDDVDEWKYRGEYIFILTTDQSGQKIEHVLEFLDSKGTDQLRGLMQRAHKKRDSVVAKE